MEQNEHSITSSYHISERWNYLGSVSFPSEPASSSVLCLPTVKRLWLCWSSEASAPLFVYKDVRSSHNQQLQNWKNKPDGMLPVPSSDSSLSAKVLPLYTVNISTKSCVPSVKTTLVTLKCLFKKVFLPIMLFTVPVTQGDRRGYLRSSSSDVARFHCSVPPFPSTVKLVQQFSGI